MNRIFIIGPGGVGKTTCGKIFAEKISYDFVDTDFEFINRIGEIDRYIEEKGYLIYRNANSNLFYELIEGRNNNTVFALSSGFLADEIDLSKHSNSIRDLGLSILLLPSESLEETEEVVVKRQVSRGLNYDEKREREKIKKRLYLPGSSLPFRNRQSAKPDTDSPYNKIARMKAFDIALEVRIDVRLQLYIFF